MNISMCEIAGVMLLEPRVFVDERGSFSETYSARTLKEHGIDTVFVQDNHSKTTEKGTLRGIHFQNEPRSQIKLIRCIRGKILDVVVDLRKSSPTYTKWISFELDEERSTQVWVPAGFGHGFLTLEDRCEVVYKTSEFYYPEFDRSIAWNDPEIAIDWPIENPNLSAKDAAAPNLCRSDMNFV